MAVQLQYKKGEGQAYNNLGVVETIHDNKELAIGYYSKALKIREDLDDQKGVASLYNNIGNLYAEQDSFTAAIDNLKLSLRIRETLKDTVRIARVYHNLADAYADWGDYTAALDHAFKYREWSALTNDPYNLLNVQNLMGNILTELERWNEAGEYLQKAVQLAEQLENEWEMGIAYNNMGNHQDDLAEKLYKEGNFSKAYPEFLESISLLEKSLALRQKEGEQSSISDSYNNLGVVYKNFGSYYAELEKSDSATICYEKALGYFDQAMEIRNAEENSKGMIEVFNGIGDVKRRQELWKEAVGFAERCLAIAKRIQDGKSEQEAYQDLSKAYAGAGNYKVAYKFQKKYADIRHERLNEDRVRMNIRREALYGDFTKQIEIERKEAELRQAAIEKRALTVERRALAGGGMALLLLALLLFNRNRIKNKANKVLEEKNDIIESEREKSESLLLNILPEATAHELKKKGKTVARSYESVSVLFTDFESFTQLTEQMTAEELVSLLDDCYRQFDGVITRHGIEKIKTIGDAYMCAAGLPAPNDTHAHDLVQAGLEMQKVMKQINENRVTSGLRALTMRIGIHSGPVVAGVVGSKKFAYDIWGDTVNVAARMEASGEPGEVNISAATYEWVKNDFICHHRGKLSAKNKGELDMYFVEKAAK